MVELLLRAALGTTGAINFGIGAALHSAAGFAGAAFVAGAADGERRKTEGHYEGFDILHSVKDLYVNYCLFPPLNRTVGRSAGGNTPKLRRIEELSTPLSDDLTL